MPTNPDRRIQLSMATQSVFTTGVSQSYKLIVDASQGNLMPNEIFLWTRSVAQGEPDTFQGICTPIQLQTLPISNPTPNSDNLFYRSNHMEQLYSDPVAAISGWNEIVQAVTQLKNALDFSDATNAPVSFWVGVPPAGG